MYFDDEKLILYWLANSGASTRKLNALLEVYSASEVWEGIKHEHFENALGDKATTKLRKTQNVYTLEREMEKLQRKDILIVARGDKEYPERLAQKEVNPPLLLYARGDISLLDTNCVAVVGSRRSTRYGKEAVEKIVAGLVGGGVTVVSGLATGIDAYAHAQAIASGGKTIAVLGAGFDHIYPYQNIPLHNKILSSGGLVVCEYPPEQEPAKYTFPERNRIVSGLSLGTVVVEAGLSSGSLITVQCAHEQGREVFAVPGNITSTQSEGTNELIYKGSARFIVNATQILEEFKLTSPEIKKNITYQLDFLEQKIYNLLGDDPRPFDELAMEAGMSPGELNSLLSSLELKGAIKKLPSNFYSK